ncbi:MAG: TM0996/MTH895 family glutaredoxin-like protein [Candidatus Eiseniibacteriota bacterium]|nr:MAG: TM0996/MTH895 family glutaredoxin-like protein [Candidatus Eisenbacteria bacterium]
MKKIQILGTGCPKCNQLEQNARKAVDQSGAEYEVEKISDLKEIMKFGVMITPTLAIDGQVKASGKVLSVEEILRLL